MRPNAPQITLEAFRYARSIVSGAMWLPDGRIVLEQQGKDGLKTLCGVADPVDDTALTEPCTCAVTHIPLILFWW